MKLPSKIHRGRHPNEYHKYIIAQASKIKNRVNGNPTKFLKKFKKVVKWVEKHPEYVRKFFWNK